MIYDYGIAKVRPATPEDAESLGPRLRLADKQELEAATEETPSKALLRGVTQSSKAYAITMPNGLVVGLFGVAPTGIPGFGAVWMLASDELLSVRYAFLKHSRKWVLELFKGFTLLGNVVDSRNTVHLAWLKWLGFRFVGSRPLGRNGEDFTEFVGLESDFRV